MNILRYKIAATVLSIFISTALFAQEKKSKPEVSADQEREHRARKMKSADSSRHERRIIEKMHQVDSTKHERRIRLKEHRVDSAKHERRILIKEHRADSVHSKRELLIRKQKREVNDQRNPGKNIRLRKVQVSLPCKPDATVFLHNVMHQVNIVTTDNDKVTLVAKVLYQGESTLTDIEWFSKMQLSLSGDENEIEVHSVDLPTNAATDGRQLDSIYNGVPVFDSVGNVIGARSQADRSYILYLPKGAKVDIESKYADITFDNNAGKIKAKISNGVLNLMDADELVSNSTYARIYAGRIHQADVEVINGKFTAKNIDTLRIISSNSMVGVDKVEQLYINNSQADQYSIEEVKHISGSKAFGSLQVTALSGSVDISGKNADVKIRRIKPSATGVNITTQYANLLLPTNNLKNYTVAFEGSGGTVHAPFKKRAATDVSFSASVGKSHLRPTAFRLICQDCTVDFN